MAENIKRHLDKLGLNTKDFASIMNFKYSTVLDWVNAKTYPRIDKIELMARYFKVDKSDLVEKHKENNTLSEITRISSELEPPRQKNVLSFAKGQKSEQEKAIEEAKKRERKILSLDRPPVDIAKIPGYMPYDPNTEGVAPILGNIAAGYNIMAEENFDGMMPVSAEYAGRDDVFWLHIKGKSMESLIHDGSFGLFEHSEVINDGKIAAIMAEDGSWVTVKHVFHEFDENGYLLRLILVPENEECETIVVNEYNPAKIIGRLLEVKQFF